MGRRNAHKKDHPFLCCLDWLFKNEVDGCLGNFFFFSFHKGLIVFNLRQNFFWMEPVEGRFSEVTGIGGVGITGKIFFGVTMDVAGEPPKIFFILHQNSLINSLIKMANPLVIFIKIARVTATQRSHKRFNRALFILF